MCCLSIGLQQEMGSHADHDLLDTVLICRGNVEDPSIKQRINRIAQYLQRLVAKDNPNRVRVHKIERWNSVRVTLRIPRDAAIHLRRLALQGASALRELGILSVQLEGDQLISLTFAGQGNAGTTEVVLTQATSSSTPPPPSSLSTPPSSSQGSSSAPSPNSLTQNLPPALFEIFSKNEPYQGPQVVVAANSDPLPSHVPRIPSVTRPASCFPFASMVHAAAAQSASNSSSVSPSFGVPSCEAGLIDTKMKPGPVPYGSGVPMASPQSPTLHRPPYLRPPMHRASSTLASSPLLVNLLQNPDGGSGGSGARTHPRSDSSRIPGRHLRGSPQSTPPAFRQPSPFKSPEDVSLRFNCFVQPHRPAPSSTSLPSTPPVSSSHFSSSPHASSPLTNSTPERLSMGPALSAIGGAGGGSLKTGVSAPGASSQLTSKGKPRQYLINPLTGDLEPADTSESSDSDQHSPFQDESSELERRKRIVEAQTGGLDQGDKIKKIRLKLGKVAETATPSNTTGYKVDVSFLPGSTGGGDPGGGGSVGTSSPSLHPDSTALSSSSSTSEPRVPPLHISLKGRGAVVLKGEDKGEGGAPSSSSLPSSPAQPPSSPPPLGRTFLTPSSTSPDLKPPPSPQPASDAIMNRIKVKMKDGLQALGGEGGPGETHRLNKVTPSDVYDFLELPPTSSFASGKAVALENGPWTMTHPVPSSSSSSSVSPSVTPVKGSEPRQKVVTVRRSSSVPPTTSYPSSGKPPSPSPLSRSAANSAGSWLSASVPHASCGVPVVSPSSTSAIRSEGGKSSSILQSNSFSPSSSSPPPPLLPASPPPSLGIKDQSSPPRLPSSSPLVTAHGAACEVVSVSTLKNVAAETLASWGEVKRETQFHRKYEEVSSSSSSATTVSANATSLLHPRVERLKNGGLGSSVPQAKKVVAVTSSATDQLSEKENVCNSSTPLEVNCVSSLSLVKTETQQQVVTTSNHLVATSSKRDSPSAAEDSGIESMDAQSEKSPNLSESPTRKEETTGVVVPSCSSLPSSTTPDIATVKAASTAADLLGLSVGSPLNLPAGVKMVPVRLVSVPPGSRNCTGKTSPPSSGPPSVTSTTPSPSFPVVLGASSHITVRSLVPCSTSTSVRVSNGEAMRVGPPAQTFNDHPLVKPQPKRSASPPSQGRPCYTPPPPPMESSSEENPPLSVEEEEDDLVAVSSTHTDHDYVSSTEEGQGGGGGSSTTSNPSTSPLLLSPSPSSSSASAGNDRLSIDIPEEEKRVLRTRSSTRLSSPQEESKSSRKRVTSNTTLPTTNGPPPPSRPSTRFGRRSDSGDPRREEEDRLAPLSSSNRSTKSAVESRRSKTPTSPSSDPRRSGSGGRSKTPTTETGRSRTPTTDSTRNKADEVKEEGRRSKTPTNEVASSSSEGSEDRRSSRRRSATPETEQGRPGRRRCSENAAELIKVYMGIEEKTGGNGGPTTNSQPSSTTVHANDTNSLVEGVPTAPPVKKAKEDPVAPEPKPVRSGKRRDLESRNAGTTVSSSKNASSKQTGDECTKNRTVGRRGSSESSSSRSGASSSALLSSVPPALAQFTSFQADALSISATPPPASATAAPPLRRMSRSSGKASATATRNNIKGDGHLSIGAAPMTGCSQAGSAILASDPTRGQKRKLRNSKCSDSSAQSLGGSCDPIAPAPSSSLSKRRRAAPSKDPAR